MNDRSVALELPAAFRHAANPHSADIKISLSVWCGNRAYQIQTPF